MSSPATLQRLDQLHAIVQANKLIPHSERPAEDRARVRAAWDELQALLEAEERAMFVAVKKALEDKKPEHVIVELFDACVSLARYRKFKTLWDAQYAELG